MKDLLVRFVEIDYNNKNNFKKEFICALDNVESYDRFVNFIKAMKDERIILKDKMYEIKDFSAGYGGNSEEDLFYLNVYCAKWF